MTGKCWLKPDHLGRLGRLLPVVTVQFGALANHSNEGLPHGQRIRWSCSTVTDIQ